MLASSEKAINNGSFLLVTKLLGRPHKKKKIAVTYGLNIISSTSSALVIRCADDSLASSSMVRSRMIQDTQPGVGAKGPPPDIAQI